MQPGSECKDGSPVPPNIDTSRRKGRLTVQTVKWPASLAVLKQASNLGNLISYRLSEPPSGD